ncbi:MAG: hypothetical protein MRY83_19000 [Flavobacteriales bacterium]|nr:hypothetical protein [Flavobacteriales bacterium]
MKIYWIKQFMKGQLGMMPRPRGNDWLPNEIYQLKDSGVQCLVSLLEDHEIFELGLKEEATLCKATAIEYINYPIRDRSIPKDFDSFLELIKVILDRLKTGKKVVIHCRIGIGRTSLLAASIMALGEYDDNIDNVFSVLSETRTLEVPDTEEQKIWVKSFFNRTSM